MTMRRICISLGINEHTILKILKDNNYKVSLLYIRKKINSKCFHLQYLSVLSTTMLRLIKKDLIEYVGDIKKLRYFRNYLNNIEREKEAQLHFFMITKRGQLMLNLFKEEY